MNPNKVGEVFLPHGLSLACKLDSFWKRGGWSSVVEFERKVELRLKQARIQTI